MNSNSLPPTSPPSRLDRPDLGFDARFTTSSPASPSPSSSESAAPSESVAPEEVLLTVEDVQKQLRRSRASVYRYTNTDPDPLHPQFDAQKLNPEVRTNREDPLKFHPREVRRFARDVLGLNPTIEVQTPPETATQELLKEILTELKSIHETLKSQS